MQSYLAARRNTDFRTLLLARAGCQSREVSRGGGTGQDSAQVQWQASKAARRHGHYAATHSSRRDELAVEKTQSLRGAQLAAQGGWGKSEPLAGTFQKRTRWSKIGSHDVRRRSLSRRRSRSLRARRLPQQGRRRIRRRLARSAAEGRSKAECHSHGLRAVETAPAWRGAAGQGDWRESPLHLNGVLSQCRDSH